MLSMVQLIVQLVSRRQAIYPSELNFYKRLLAKLFTTRSSLVRIDTLHFLQTIVSLTPRYIYVYFILMYVCGYESLALGCVYSRLLHLTQRNTELSSNILPVLSCY